jgi:hypothetical protein
MDVVEVKPNEEGNSVDEDACIDQALGENRAFGLSSRIEICC